MYTIRNIQPGSDSDLNRGLYIVIIHVFRIPPHLLLCYNGKLFSLSIKGRQTGEDVALLLKAFEPKGLPILFCKVRELQGVSGGEVVSMLEKSVRRFERVGARGATCLSPLKCFFEEYGSLDVSSVNFIFDLLPLLDEQGLLEANYSLHFESDTFTFVPYTKDDIEKEIEKRLSNSSNR